MAYTYYRSITIDHTKCGATDSSNFPVLFDTTDATLKTVGNGGHIQNSNGYDFAFFSDSALTSALNFDLKAYNASTGQVVAHVNVPTVSHTSDTVIYVGYGDSGISTYQGNNAATWNANFKSVYTLGNGSTLDLTDHKTGANTGTGHNTTAAAGQHGGAASFNGSTSYIANFASLIAPNSATMSILAEIKTTSAARGGILGTRTNGVPDVGFIFSANLSASGNLSLVSIGGTNLTAAAGISSGTPARVGATVNTATTTAVLYKDGSSVGSNSSFAYGGSTTFEGVLGDEDASAPDSPFSGLIADIQIATVALSADWYLTDYNNWNNPSTFYTLGSETPVAAAVTIGWYRPLEVYQPRRARSTEQPPAIALTPGTLPPQISGMGWFQPRDTDRRSAYVKFTSPPAFDPQPIAAASTIAGMAWFEPPDRDKRATKVTVEAPPALVLTPATLPPQITGMGWFAPRDQDRRSAIVRFESPIALVLRPITGTPISGMAWFEPPDRDMPRRKVRIEAPPAIALTPITLPPRIAGMGWFNPPDRDHPPVKIFATAPETWWQNLSILNIVYCYLPLISLMGNTAVAATGTMTNAPLPAEGAMSNQVPIIGEMGNATVAATGAMTNLAVGVEADLC